MANIRDIAQQSGVSITTVSRVLNNLPGVSQAARQAVMTAVNEAGYVPGVGRRCTSNIALVYTGAPTLDSPFDTALLVGMHEGLQTIACDLMLLDAHRSRHPKESFSHMFLRKGVQGALVRTTTSSQSLCLDMAREGFPMVAVGYRFEHSQVNCIYSDSREASGKAMEHLIALGHRRIAVCIHLVDDSDHADRVEAYRRGLLTHGLPFEERLILRVEANRDGGVQVIRRIVTMAPRPTALFLSDPLISVGVLNEARRVGLRVPEDLSVVGFDDAELRHCLVPQLTAVCQDTRALGREAVTFLSHIIAHPAGVNPTPKALRCWLEVHDSTAPHAAPAGQDQPMVPGARAGETILRQIRKKAASAPIQDSRAAARGPERTLRHHGKRPKHHSETI
jgi:DNA-binding LacI/PurR family transcriptional regulator